MTFISKLFFLRTPRFYSYLPLFLLFFTASAELSADWKIENGSSQIAFTAFSRMEDVNGVFHKWNFLGKIEDDFSGSGRITIETASIDTGNYKRDVHLRNKDFFHVGAHSSAVFEISDMKTSGHTILISGRLTIKGSSKQLQIPLDRKNIQGGILLSGGFLIRRSDFKITYNSNLNPIQDEVKIKLKIILVRI